MKYIAKTQLALNVVRNGKSIHVTFTPQTGGGSVFYTDDPSVAKALESHYKFGKLFKKAEEKVQAPSAIPVAKAAEKVPAKAEVKKERTLTFPCYEDAKDYLVETYGISRTKLRSQTAIEAAAKANNIKLVISD